MKQGTVILKFDRTNIVFAVLHNLYCACISCEHTDSICHEVQFLHILHSFAQHFQTQNPSQI